MALGADVSAGFFRVKAATNATITSGVLTVTQAEHIVVAESGASDDLDTINISTSLIMTSGYLEILILTAKIGQTIAIKHNTGNILCNSGADVSLTENKAAILVRFALTTTSDVNNKWRCIA
jgi:hypothetical protein